MSDEAPPSVWRRLGWPLVQVAGTLVAVALVMQVVGWLRAPALPDEAPGFALPDLDGRQVRLADLRGRPVLLNFWATWCGPCRLEAPAFSRFAATNEDFAVLGIAADGPAPRLRRARDELGITYTVLQGDAATLRAYNVGSFPTTVLVGPDGRVAGAHVGLMLDPQIAWFTLGYGGEAAAPAPAAAPPG
jgi:thiol-disulfide isomerase/thioredoxin